MQENWSENGSEGSLTENDDGQSDGCDENTSVYCFEIHGFKVVLE